MMATKCTYKVMINDVAAAAAARAAAVNFKISFSVSHGTWWYAELPIVLVWLALVMVVC